MARRKLKINNKTSTITMIKNHQDFINEDSRSEEIALDISHINLTQLYSNIQLKYNDSLKIVISNDKKIELNDEFYEALKLDHVKPKDIIFENCTDVAIYEIKRFTKISDYGGFGENIKNFNCSYCSNLTSLDGTPKKVGRCFSCSKCENLTSLKGVPEKVGGYFSCSSCKKLTSLDGSPEIVYGDFWCSGCSKLASLNGAPDVCQDFSCSNCNKLTSLDDAPKKVGGDFSCSHCDNITSLQGAPETIGGDFICRNCNSDFIKLAKAKYGDKVKDK